MIRKLLVKTAGAALAVSCALGGTPAQAATLVDTGSGRNGHVGDVWYGQTMIERIFGQITLTKASHIDTIEGYIASYGGKLGVSLRSDRNGMPGDVLSALGKTYSTAFTLKGGRGLPDSQVNVWQGATDLGWQVAAGTYWISFENDTNGDLFSAPYMQFYAADRPLSKYAESGRGKIYSSNGGFGFRVFGDVSAVPEPATWAIMIVGFGLTGGALRRRRKADGRGGHGTMPA